MAENIRYLAEPDFVGTQFHVSGRCEMEIRLGIPGLLMWKMPWLQSACAAYWGWILKGSAMHWSISG